MNYINHTSKDDPATKYKTAFFNFCLGEFQVWSLQPIYWRAGGEVPTIFYDSVYKL